MNRETDQIWTTLIQSGVVQGQEPELDKIDSPWYVKVLLAFSGWLAALFFLGFIGVGFQFILKSSAASFLTGGLMIGGAFVLLQAHKNEFFEHLSLAVSLAGQALVAVGIFKVFKESGEMAWVMMGLLQVVLAILMPNFVHRVFSAFMAVFALSMALSIMGVPDILNSIVMFLAAWLWLNEFRYARQMSKIRAIGYGLVLALIQLKGSVLFGGTSLGWRPAHNSHAVWVMPWMGEVLAGMVTLYVVWKLLQRCNHVITDSRAIVALLGTLLLCAVSMEARGITAGMVVMMLGFAGSNRVLMGLGIASLLFYISSYYYLLDATLLAKAQTLLIVGLVLLAARWLMGHMMGDKETQHV